MCLCVCILTVLPQVVVTWIYSNITKDFLLLVNAPKVVLNTTHVCYYLLSFFIAGSREVLISAPPHQTGALSFPTGLHPLLQSA